MARKIIILEQQPKLPGEVAFRFAMWADVPAARQARYANPAFVSAVAGLSQAELDELRAGQIVEQVEDARWPAGTTVPSIQALLVTRFQAFQAEVTAANPWQRYGTNWDGSTWTPVNNS